VNGYKTLGTPDRVVKGKVIPGRPPRNASKKTRTSEVDYAPYVRVRNQVGTLAPAAQPRAPRQCERQSRTEGR
jgi:hypothetical protein